MLHRGTAKLQQRLHSNAEESEVIAQLLPIWLQHSPNL